MTVAVQAAPDAAVKPAEFASNSPLSSKELVPVPKPDDAHYDALIKEETDAIETLRKRINELNETLAAQSSGREEFMAQRDAQRRKIDQITARIDLLVEERDKIQERTSRAQEQGRNLRSQVETIQRNLGFTTVEEIDKRIEQIQYEMMVSTLSLKEEKKLISDIEKLRKSKPELQKIAELQERAASAEQTGSTGFRDRLSEIRDELGRLRDARREESQKLSDLINERNKQQEPLRDLREERDELRRKMGVHQSRVNQLQSERRAKDTEYRAYQARLRNARVEVERWERQRAQIEADKNLVHQDLSNLKEGVYDWRSMLAMQVIAYMKEQIAAYEEAVKKAAGSEDEETPEAEAVEIEIDDNKFRTYRREKLEPPTLGKKGKKARKGQKGKEKVVPDKLHHTLATIKDFSTLGFDKDYPLTIKDCPKAIAKLEAIINEQKVKNLAVEELNAKKREQLEKRLKELEAKEAALLAAMPEEAKKKNKNVEK